MPGRSSSCRLVIVTNSPHEVASAVADHSALKSLARAGYAVNGLLHLLIAAIVAQVGVGGGGEAEPSGALQAVAEAPFAAVVLWIVLLGYAGLACWQVLDATTGYRPGSESASLVDRAKDVAKAGVYAALGWTAWRFVSGGGTDSGESTADFTATLMGAPFGRFLVAAVAAGVIAVGVYHVWKGLTRAFLQDLKDNADGQLGRAVIVLGMIGYVAKGSSLILVGVLFGWATWTANPEEATGLDGAVATVSTSPYGTVILIVVSLGFAAYGIYSFARSRYARL